MVSDDNSGSASRLAGIVETGQTPTEEDAAGLSGPVREGFAMTPPDQAPAQGHETSIRVVEHDSYREYYVNSAVTDPSCTREGAAAVFVDVAGVVEQLGIQCIVEKVFGADAERDWLLQARKEAYEGVALDPDGPLTFIDGHPVDEVPLAGVQIWGVAPRDKGRTLVEPIWGHGRNKGVRWAGDGFRILYFPALMGADDTGVVGGSPSDQASLMIQTAGATLAKHDLGFTDVVRTWIYMRRILDWYGEFNRVRTEYFAEHGITGAPDGVPFPASTGIQGHCDGEECMMDVLAFDCAPDGPVRFRPVEASDCQDQAFKYGSAFSRATLVEHCGKRTMYVSGTASIDGAGATVRHGDHEGQVLQTLMSIAALIDAEGGGLKDISMATVYCKDRKAYDAYARVVQRLGIPAFPAVCTIADVCRDELLIEIEAIACVR